MKMAFRIRQLTLLTALCVLLWASPQLRGEATKEMKDTGTPGQTAMLEELPSKRRRGGAVNDEDSDEPDDHVADMMRLRQEGGMRKLDRKDDVEVFGPAETEGGRIVDPEEYGATFYMMIEPYEMYCFFQPTKKETLLHVLFHVESEERIQYPDVDMEVTDPSGTVVLREEHSIGNVEGYHEEEHQDADHQGSNVLARMTGDYKICFSNKNSNSASARKKLFLDIGPVLSVKYKTLPDSDIPAVVSARIEESLATCQEHLDQVMEIQMTQRRGHKQDLHIVATNQDMVTYRSLLIMMIMFVVASIQTVFIRKLFGNASNV